MKYEFPIIKHFDDIKDHIDPEFFIVAKKDGYQVVNYAFSCPDTFPKDDWVKREFRGLIFDYNGNLLRRPYHKFFNVNERTETNLSQIDVSQSHIIMDKLDGSMIAFFRVGKKEYWGTKMVDMSFHERVSNFVDKSPIKYREFCNDVFSSGYTPIFEWMSPTNRIVVDYGQKEKMVLTAIRHMETGQYIPIHGVK